MGLWASKRNIKKSPRNLHVGSFDIDISKEIEKIVNSKNLGGLYSGTGTVPSGTVATLTDTLEIQVSGEETGLYINGSLSGLPVPFLGAVKQAPVSEGGAGNYILNGIGDLSLFGWGDLMAFQGMIGLTSGNAYQFSGINSATGDTLNYNVAESNSNEALNLVVSEAHGGSDAVQVLVEAVSDGNHSGSTRSVVTAKTKIGSTSTTTPHVSVQAEDESGTATQLIADFGTITNGDTSIWGLTIIDKAIVWGRLLDGDHWVMPGVRSGVSGSVLVSDNAANTAWSTIPDALGGIQSALTVKDASVANSGDATTDGIINNNRTRIAEIETALQNLGLLS